MKWTCRVVLNGSNINASINSNSTGLARVQFGALGGLYAGQARGSADRFIFIYAHNIRA